MSARPFNNRSNHSDVLLEGVVEAVNKIADPAAKQTVVDSLRVHVPNVRWFVNSRGIVDAVLT